MKFKIILIFLSITFNFKCDAQRGGGGKGGGGGSSPVKTPFNKPLPPPPGWYIPGKTTINKPNKPIKIPSIKGNTHITYSTKNYGKTFGNRGLPANTYIAQKYYRAPKPGGGFRYLTNSLYTNRLWYRYDDRRWRATTKAPYFENKVPGSEVILPASAVVGAATAFGLASLLPLNVPSNKPLMYCNENSTEITQAKILINGKVYQCINETIYVNCLKLKANGSTTVSQTTSTESSTESQNASTSINNTSTDAPVRINNTNNCDGRKKIMQCGTADNIYCTNGTLLSRFNIFCNSTAKFGKIVMLKCYKGYLGARHVAFIPTTTEAEEKSLSFAAKVHLWFLNLIGKGDIIKESDWIPKPLTLNLDSASAMLDYLEHTK